MEGVCVSGALDTCSDSVRQRSGHFVALVVSPTSGQFLFWGREDAEEGRLSRCVQHFKSSREQVGVVAKLGFRCARQGQTLSLLPLLGSSYGWLLSLDSTFFTFAS